MILGVLSMPLRCSLSYKGWLGLNRSFKKVGLTRLLLYLGRLINPFPVLHKVAYAGRVRRP